MAKKIMFSDKYGLTQAVLDERKTQTRCNVPESTLRKAKLEVKVCGGSVEDKIIEQTPYCFGEEVAVAQSYKTVADYDHNFCIPNSKGFFNKMFVRADLMPHRIKITNIRVEHLQDISDEDCLKEGIDRCEKEWGYWEGDNGFLNFYACDTIKEAFAALIDKICGKGTWERNPWVFVYDFELIR